MAAEELDVVVIGAGQAGLATSHELARAGVAHVVLERADHLGGAWARRWDSFCLVTPNHTIRLPGAEYRGTDPHGFLTRDEIVTHLREYADRLGAPIRTGVEVTSLTARPEGSVTLRTADERTIHARHAVVATGAFQAGHRPGWVAAAQKWLPVLEAAEYRNPDSLPPGAVLVVGSGQTGCQIAEELALSGRRVILACGRAAWLPRRIEDRDIVDWLLETPFFEQAAAELPSPEARLLANPQLTGARGGHDLHTRTLAGLGVELTGHVAGVDDEGCLAFRDDLAESIQWGDARYLELQATIQGWRQRQRLPVPAIADPPPFDAGRARAELDLRELSCLVLTAGFRPDYRSWIDIPEAFDDLGFPQQSEGTSTRVAGLHFTGVHFLRTRKSALLLGVGEDARIVANTVAGQLPRR